MSEESKRIVVVISDGTYGLERAYNGVRVAMSLAKREAIKVRVFLLRDGVQCVIKGQRTPDGNYNLERTMSSIAKRGEVAT